MDGTCGECGGRHGVVPCAQRFERLLALDHSREEPWGSRHFLAFACYGLQHPSSVDRASLERSWLGLRRVCRGGAALEDVVRGLRANPRVTPADWGEPPLPDTPPAPGDFRTTIVDLGEFAAASYAASVMEWCHATVDAWEGRVGR
jgi:hypothetical protein